MRTKSTRGKEKRACKKARSERNESGAREPDRREGELEDYD